MTNQLRTHEYKFNWIEIVTIRACKNIFQQPKSTLGGVQLCMLGGCLAEEGDKGRDICMGLVFGAEELINIDHECM